MADLIKNNNFRGISKAFETDKLDALLEEASRKGGRESKFTKKTSFAPSSFYHFSQGVCPRYWYYAFNGAEFSYENTARQRANMDSGTAAGERIAKLFESAGILNESELPVRHEDPPIFGYIDIDVTWQDERMIGEVKTTTEQSFNIRSAAMAAPGYQLIQLLIYLRLTRTEKGFFVVENKNDHSLLIIPVKMNDKYNELLDYVFDWMRKVKANADNGELPIRPFTKSSWNCKGCPVRETCWGDKKFNRGSPNDPNPGTVDLPVLEIPK